MFGLLTVAVAAMVMGTAVATAAPGQPGEATFGTATAMITLPGSDPRLAAGIAAIRQRYDPVDVIDNENLGTGTTQNVQLRAEDPHAAFGSPMLALVSGRYPAAPGQVALTSVVADLYGVSRGGVVRLGGRAYRVTGFVQNPSNLRDEFALVEPRQVTDPTQVSILLDAPRGGIRGLPTATVVSYPGNGGSGISPAAAASVLGLVFVGLVAVAGFTVMTQRRLRALGMLSSLGATSRNIQLVMIANGAAVGAAAVVAGSAAGFGAWLAYVPRLRAAAGHVIDPLALPWGVISARSYHRDAGGTLASARGGTGSRGRRAIWPPAAGAGRAPVRAERPDHARRRAGPAADDRRGRRPWRPADRHGDGDVPAGGRLRDCPGRGNWAAVAGGGAHRAARSGAALAAVSFAVFLAMATTLGASFRFSMALDWTGENLTSSQLIVYTNAQGGGANGGPQGRQHRPSRKVAGGRCPRR